MVSLLLSPFRPPRRRSWVAAGVRRLTGAALLWTAFAVVLLPAQAQDSASRATDDDPSALFETAKAHYQQGAFQEAAELFATVAETASYREMRREALKFMGRTYIVLDRPEAARAAMTDLLRLEPPIIELDPEVEPPPIMSVYYDARRELSNTLCWTGQKRPDGSCQTDEGLKTLAVIDFRNDSIDERERFGGLQWGLPTMMIQHLNGATQLRLIERERLQWLKQEIDLAKDGYMDPQTAARAGRLLGATNVMLGSFMVFGDQITIWARLVETETGQILLGDQVQGKVKNFHALTKTLSRTLAETIGSELPSSTTGEQQGPSRSLDAMLAYSDALKLIEDGRYLLATQKLEEAIGHDPTYAAAQNRLESLQPMLAAAASDTDRQ
jgi:TolB-like protein